MIRRIVALIATAVIIVSLVGCNQNKVPMPENYPIDIIGGIYPNSKLDNSEMRGTEWHAVYRSKDETNDVVKYYREEIENDKRITLDNEERDEDGYYRAIGILDDDYSFGIVIHDENYSKAYKTTIVIEIEEAELEKNDESNVEVHNSQIDISTNEKNDELRPSLNTSELSEGFYIKRDNRFYECGFKDNLYSPLCNAFMIPIADMTYDIIEIKKADTLIARASYMPDYVYIAPVEGPWYTYGGMLEWENDNFSLRSIPDNYHSLGDTDLFSTFLFLPKNDPTIIEKINDQEIDLLDESKILAFAKTRGFKYNFAIYLGEKNETVKFTYYEGMDKIDFTTKTDVAIYFHYFLEGDRDLDTLDMDGYESMYETEYVDRADFHLTDEGYIVIDYDFPSTGMYIIRSRARYDRFFTTIVNVVE